MLISSNFAFQTRWSIFALDPQMHQVAPGHGHWKCVALCCFLVKLKYTILDILKVKFYVIFFKKIFMFLFLFLFLNLQIWYIPIILELHSLVLWVPLMYVSEYTLINHFKKFFIKGWESYKKVNHIFIKIFLK